MNSQELVAYTIGLIAALTIMVLLTLITFIKGYDDFARGFVLGALFMVALSIVMVGFTKLLGHLKSSAHPKNNT